MVSALSRQVRLCCTLNSFRKSINQSISQSPSSSLGTHSFYRENNPCYATLHQCYLCVGEVFLRGDVSLHRGRRCGHEDFASRTVEHFNLCHVVIFLQSWQNKDQTVFRLRLSGREDPVMAHLSYLPWSTLSSMARLHWRLLYSMTSYRSKNVHHHPDTPMCQHLFVFLWYIQVKKQETEEVQHKNTTAQTEDSTQQLSIGCRVLNHTLYYYLPVGTL